MNDDCDSHSVYCDTLGSSHLWYGRGREGEVTAGVEVKMTPSWPPPPCVPWTPCVPGKAWDHSAAYRTPRSSTRLVPSSPGRLCCKRRRRALQPCCSAGAEGVGGTPYPPRPASTAPVSWLSPCVPPPVSGEQSTPTRGASSAGGGVGGWGHIAIHRHRLVVLNDLQIRINIPTSLACEYSSVNTHTCTQALHNSNCCCVDLLPPLHIKLPPDPATWMVQPIATPTVHSNAPLQIIQIDLNVM